MAHLTGFGLENFRVFEKETWFDFAPITIFTGTNSSGKSSVNKALLLLDESFKSNKNFRELDFQTEKHNLNIIENTFTKNSKNEILNFTERYKLFNHREISVESETFFSSTYTFEGDSDILPFTDFLEIKKSFSKKDNKVQLIKIDFSLKYGNEPENILKVDFANGIIEISIFPLIQIFNTNLVDVCNEMVSNISVEGKIITDDFNSLMSKVEKKEQFLEKYNCLKLNLEKIKFNENVSLIQLKANNYNAEYLLEFILNEIIKRKSNIKDFFISQDDIPSIESLNATMSYGKISKMIQTYFTEIVHSNITINIDFLDSIVKQYEDVFSEDQKFIIECKSRTLNNIFSENIDEIFKDIIMPELECFDKLVNFSVPVTFIEAVRANTQRVYTFQSQGTSINSLLSEIWKTGLSERKEKFLSKWVKEFGIADRVEINNIKNTANEIQLVRGDERIDLADVGYGFTQLLPLILKAVNDCQFKDAEWCDLNNYSSTKINPTNNRILIIEEPEVNLHPALQSKIADFIVDFSRNFDATVIIETHSEYLIRRLQFLTAKKEIIPEDTIIHYLFHPESDHTKSTGEQLRTIHIKEDGRLDKEFGTGFFDEADNLTLSLYSYNKNQLN